MTDQVAATDVVVPEDLLRTLAPQALGAIARRSTDFAAAEDAVQEALLAATTQWPRDGIPDNPRGWLISVAHRRLIDQIRSDVARRHRELEVADAPEAGAVSDVDDTVALLFLCCHPSLSSASAIALTLRAVGGLTTREIADAFLVPEATMAQRISRAKQRIRTTGATFPAPTDSDVRARLVAVQHTLYLMFNEGYVSTSGQSLTRVELSREAIRLTRILHQGRPADAEVAGLLALMLLTDARRAARTTDSGALVPLGEQDRSRWNQGVINEGVALLEDALARHAVGPFQIQAAVAALHDRAPSVEETDWPQIAALYAVLERLTPGPMVTLNRAIAVAEAQGPSAGLALLDTLAPSLGGHHRWLASRGHLLARLGDSKAARDHFTRAAALTTSRPERDHLLLLAACQTPQD